MFAYQLQLSSPQFTDELHRFELLMGGLLVHVRDRCITSPSLLIAIIGFNLWIARSYLPIGWRLMRVRRRVGGHVFKRGEIRLLAIFVASCGVTHLFTVAALFFPFLDWPTVGWGLWTGWISARARRVLEESEEDLVRLVLGFRELHKKVYGDEGGV